MRFFVIRVVITGMFLLLFADSYNKVYGVVEFDFATPREEIRLSSFTLDRFITIKVVESIYTGRKFILILVWPLEGENFKDEFILWRYRQIADRWAEGWNGEFVEQRGHYYIYVIPEVE